MLTILTLTNLAQAEPEIRLESLDKGPGLLPFKLGQTRVVSHFHTFLQYTDLGDIGTNIDKLKAQLSEASQMLNNSSFNVFKYQIKYLYSKLGKVSAQLDTFKPNRLKRGLIDPLGSLIKSLTGNLDHEDAVQFNNALNVLQNNEKTLSTGLNKHISLCKEWISSQKQIVLTLVSNQEKLEKTLYQMNNASHNDKKQLLHYAHLSQLFVILSENINDLLEELFRIENVLAFSKVSKVHHSILNLHLLKDIVSSLRKLYDSDQILALDIRDYYDFLKIGSYLSGNNLVVVLRVPILYKSNYDLYRLCPLPNQQKEILIPPYPYIATNTHEYVYVEAECPKSGEWYICEQKLSHQIRSEQDCIQKLIHQQEIDSTCKPTPISLHKEALLELDDQHYAVTFPKPTKVQLNCQQEQHVILEGSYAVTIPHNCLLKTSEFTLININNKLRGQPLKITSVPLQLQKNEDSRMPTLKMNTINLNALSSIERQIAFEDPVQIDTIQSSSIYHTTVPLYVLALLTSGAVIILLYRRYCLKTERDCKETIEMSSVSAEDRKKAIFALDISK